MKVDGLITIPGAKIPGAPAGGRHAAGTVNDIAGLGDGLLFKGKIVASSGDGRIQLAINDRIISAESRLPLQPGTELWLEVKSSGRTVLLAPAAKKGAVQDLLRLVLSDSETVKKTIQGLVRYGATPEAHFSRAAFAKFGPLFRLFSSFAFTADQNLPKLLAMLPHVFGDNGGMITAPAGASHQQPLAVLLAGFLGFLKEAAGSGTMPRPAEMAGLEKFLEYAQVLQQLNSHATPPGEPPYYLFPCFFAAEAGWGQWLVSLNADDGPAEYEDPEAATLQFFLEMSRLGGVHLQVRVGKERLQGGFQVENKKIADHLLARIPLLQAALAKLGFAEPTFSCRVATHSLAREFREAVQKTARLQGVALLDVTV